MVLCGQSSPNLGSTPTSESNREGGLSKGPGEGGCEVGENSTVWCSEAKGRKCFKREELSS